MISAAAKPALAIMARAPVPGAVKTRLQPRLTPEQCASLSRAFLEDAIDLAASAVRYAPHLAFTPPDARPLFEEMVSRRMGLITQRGDDLGARMANVIDDLARAGHVPIVVIGSDLPTLQPKALTEALSTLATHDVCLGPAHDGGYCLIGLNRPSPGLFEGIRWGTPSVLMATLSRARDLGLSSGLIEPCADVDTWHDLVGLRGGAVGKHTAAWIASHASLFS